MSYPERVLFGLLTFANDHQNPCLVIVSRILPDQPYGSVALLKKMGFFDELLIEQNLPAALEKFTDVCEMQ